MAWKQNPDTGESYQVPDAAPGAGTESGQQNPNGGAKAPKVPAFNDKNYKPPVPPPLPPVLGAPQGPVFPEMNGPAPTPQGPHGYNPTTAPFGFDQSAPGTREQFWNNNQNRWFDTPGLDWVDQQLPQFQDPWQGEQVNSELLGSIAQPGAGQQYWNGITGKGNTMSGAESAISGGYKGPNNAQTAFDMTKANLPGSLQPQFDSYYDRLKQKTMGDVNAQSAARGAYGSNSALNNTIGASLDIEGQRAAAATKFSLDDSANQRNWFDSLGTQGRNADLSGLDAFGKNIEASKFGLDKTKTLGDLAFQAEGMEFDKNKELGDRAFGIDEARNKRLESGISTAVGSDNDRHRYLNDAFDASGQAQDAREGRINTLHSQLSNFSTDVQDFFSENYDKLLGADGQIDDAALEAMLAKTADERGYDQYETERLFRDGKAAADIVLGAYTAGASKAKG